MLRKFGQSPSSPDPRSRAATVGRGERNIGLLNNVALARALKVKPARLLEAIH